MGLFRIIFGVVFFMAVNSFDSVSSASAVVDIASLNPHLIALQQDRSIQTSARDLHLVGVLLRTDRQGRLLPKGQMNPHSALVAGALMSLRNGLESQPSEGARLRSVRTILNITRDWTPQAAEASYQEISRDLNEGLIVHKILFSVLHSLQQKPSKTVIEDLVATIVHLNSLAHGPEIAQRMRKPGDIWAEYLNFELELRERSLGGVFGSPVRQVLRAIQRSSLEAIQDEHAGTFHTHELQRLVRLLETLSPLEWIELQARLENSVNLQGAVKSRQEVVLGSAALVWHDVLLKNDRKLNSSARDWRLMAAQTVTLHHEDFVLRLSKALRNPERRRLRDWLGFDLVQWFKSEDVPIGDLVSLSRPFEMFEWEIRALAQGIRGVNAPGCEAILQEVANSPSISW